MNHEPEPRNAELGTPAWWVISLAERRSLQAD